MNVLFLGSDPSIFVPGSPAYIRLAIYADTIGTLHVLSRGKHTKEVGAKPNLILHAIKGPKIFSYYFLLKKARSLIKVENIALVSAQDPFEHGWIAARAVSGTNARLHIQVHTDFRSPWFVKDKSLRSATSHVSVINRIRRNIADQVLPQAAGIRTVSERVKTSLVERYGTNIPEPSVLPIGVSSSIPPRVSFPMQPYKFTLITVGRLEPEKRIEDIFIALKRIRGQYPSVGLMIVGSGRERGALERATKKHGIQDRVTFLGNRPDAWGLIQSAEAYIQASGYEGYGRTFVEAALAKVPIITTDVGIIGEVFTGYDDVLSVPPGDPAALAVQIVGLIEDGQARKLLVMNAERKARAHLEAYTDLPQRIADDLSRVLNHA